MSFLTMYIRKEHVMRIDLKNEFNAISFDDVYYNNYLSFFKTRLLLYYIYFINGYYSIIINHSFQWY
jgi:hypothetical protein